MNKYEFNPENYKEELTSILKEALKLKDFNQHKFERILKKYPKDGNKVFSKDNIIRGTDWIIDLLEDHKIPVNIFRSDEDLELLVSNLKSLISKVQMKPTRTVSGVTTVTVLTKPFACPGKCIFCPNDVRMPKSYIATEPGVGLRFLAKQKNH